MKVPWAAYKFAVQHGLEAEAKQIRAKLVHPKIKPPSAVMTADLLDLFKERDIFEEFCKQHWPNGLTDAVFTRLKFYDKQRLMNEKLLGDGPPDDDADAETDDETPEEQTFALESDLRDFLAHNLQVIEPGLRLYEEGGRSGIEFQIEGGRIDILGLDNTAKPVVIELKLSRGRNQTIGQLLYYRVFVESSG